MWKLSYFPNEVASLVRIAVSCLKGSTTLVYEKHHLAQFLPNLLHSTQKELLLIFAILIAVV